MTKKLMDLEAKPGDPAYENTFSRYVAIKEEQAQIAKDEILVLWTDYFKPQASRAVPRSTRHLLEGQLSFALPARLKLACSHANELMEAIQKIHNMFWATKNRDVSWLHPLAKLSFHK